MDFKRPKLDFKEVERRYTQLKQQQEAGDITEQEFAKQLKGLMVQDQRGRWWSKSQKSGEWHYYDGRTWVRGIPPGVHSTPQPIKRDSKKLAEERVKETEQAHTVLKDQREPAAYVGDFQHPETKEKQRQAEEARQRREAQARAAEERRRGEEERQQRALKAKVPTTTYTKPTKRSFPIRGMILSLLLLGLIGVPLLAIVMRLGVENLSSSPTADGSGVIVRDDFSSSSSGLYRGKDEYGGSGDYDTSRGVYRIIPASGRAHYTMIEKGGDIEAAQVEVDATRTDDTPKDADWGVVCRRSVSASNKNNLYFLGIQNNGRPVIGKVNDGEPRLISDANTSARVDPSATNHIRGDCVGDKLTLYVDEQKLLEASDNEFATGEVGLYAVNRMDESGTDVSFDNLSVSKP